MTQEKIIIVVNKTKESEVICHTHEEALYLIESLVELGQEAFIKPTDPSGVTR